MIAATPHKTVHIYIYGAVTMVLNYIS